MSELLVIGDVHGKWKSYADILANTTAKRSIQVGDFGWGYPGKSDTPAIVADREHEVTVAMSGAETNHKYFRGNHDNPVRCSTHEFCLPDVYYDDTTGIMTIAGASSINKDSLTQGFNWWEDEELSYDKLYEAIDLYEEKKPRIVMSHECPESIVGKMFNWYRADHVSRTRQSLDSMFAIHQPEVWFFGHWHTSLTHLEGKTLFMCLAELETVSIDV